MVPDVVMDSQPRKGESESTESQVARVVMDEAATQLEECEPPEDIVILYHTLVRDGAIPGGYEQEFSTLARAIAPGAAREQNRVARHGNVEAAVWLHEREKRKHEEGQLEQQTSAQFQWAASERPRMFRTRLERSLYAGPTARHDAEEAERQRWPHILADLVRHSPTPMAQLLAAQPGNVECEPSGSSWVGCT